MNELLEWTVEGPLGLVVLKKSTVDYHIQGDHTSEDAEFRLKLIDGVRNTVRSPRYIANDEDSVDAEGYARCIYIDSELCDDTIRIIVAFVDRRKNPNEVASFLGTKKFKVKPENVIYNRKGGNEDEVVDSV